MAQSMEYRDYGGEDSRAFAIVIRGAIGSFVAGLAGGILVGIARFMINFNIQDAGNNLNNASEPFWNDVNTHYFWTAFMVGIAATLILYALVRMGLPGAVGIFTILFAIAVYGFVTLPWKGTNDLSNGGKIMFALINFVSSMMIYGSTTSAARKVQT